MNSNVPILGNGLGLRPVHYPAIFESKPNVDWFEVITENFMDTEGRPIHMLEKIRQDYSVVCHGVSLSIGSTDALDKRYIDQLKKLIQRIQPSVVSDHLCWTGVDGNNLHDLLPIPYTEEALQHVCNRVDSVQNELQHRLVLENPSTYIDFSESTIPEWEFLKEVSNRTGCGILLDVNNVYVNAFNHGYNPWTYISSLPTESIVYMHLAGHSNRETYLFDTHDQPIAEEVWGLYEKTLELLNHSNTLIEWDGNIPPLSELLLSLDRAKIYQTSRIRNVA